MVLATAIGCEPAAGVRAESSERIDKRLQQSGKRWIPVPIETLLASQRDWPAARASRFGPDSLEAARALDLQLEATIRAVGVASSDVVPLTERIVRLKERHLSPADADIAVSLQNLSTVFTERGEYPRAVIEAQRALNIRRLALPADDPRIADSLDALALPLIQSDKYDEARQVLDESLRIREQQGTGNERPLATARTVFLESLLHRFDGNYTRATAALDRAFTLWRQTDPNHPDIAMLLRIRGDLNFLSGDVSSAERAWADALALVQRTLGAEHPGVPRLLNGLASAAQQSGDLERAGRLLEQALGIGARVLAPCHPLLSVLPNDLGNLTLYSGRFEESRTFYARALATSERCLGAKHSLTATFVHNAALLAVEMGDLTRAEALHRRALDAWSTTLGPDHPYVARGLDSLAEVMTLQGQQREAEAMLERALSIRRKALGPAHPDVAGSLVSLAQAKAAANEVPRAIRDVREAVAIYGRGGRPQEPDYLATALVLLGDLEARQGHNQPARNHFSRAAALRSEMFGAEHPLTAEAAARLASADFIAGLAGPALSSALDAERIGRDHLRFTIRYLPERQALVYAAKRPRGLDLALSISAAAATPDPAAAFDALIRSRAVILDELAARARSAATSDPAVATLVKNVTAAREKFATVMFRSVGGESVARARLDEARQQKEEAERALAERSADARAESTRARAGIDDIRRALPPDTALVSFVRYDRTVAGTRRVPAPALPSYLAFVMAAGTRTVRLVPLGPAASVETAVETWRRTLDGPSVLRGPPDAAERVYRPAASRLRQQVWDPVTPHLGGAAQVFIVPDGALSLVSFAALPTRTGYLVDDGPVIHLLSAERDLVLAEKAPVGRGLLAVGGPSYDLAPSNAGATTALRSGCASIDGLSFGDLPGSRAEVQAVARIFPSAEPSAAQRESVTVLSGRDASEGAVVRAVAGRRVLHLATHGFFLGSGCEPNLPNTRGVGGLSIRDSASAARDRAENPLLFAGLAFAGANRKASAPAGGDDGILTAEEVSGLNLQGLEWAVLSACDTGLGQIRAGEGVLGLRRAFQIAGAATVVMSLWSVDDDATRLWMQALYEARLRDGASTAEAVHRAGRAVLQNRRSLGLSTHPFYWAAFVAAGDWR